MNILYVIPFFKPYEVGGAEISTYLYAKGLNKEHRIVVLTPNYKKFSDETRLENKKFLIHRFAFPLKPKRIMVFFDSCIFQLCLFLQVIVAIKKFKIDIIHIQSSSMIPGPFFAGRLSGKKVVVTIRDHGYKFSKKSLMDELKKLCGIRKTLEPWIAVMVYINRHLRKFCIQRMDRIIAVSNYMKDCVAKKLDIENERIKVSYMVKPDWSKGQMARNGSKKYRLLFLGRLDKAKGIELLLRAFALVKQKNIELLIAGNSNVGYYKKFVKTFGIENVTFLGKIPHEKTKSIYEKADAAVVPSLRDEPLSRVLIEAGCLGKPIIATDRGGSSEVVINKKTGVLIKDISPKGFSNGIEYVIKNPRKAKEMGRNMKKLANSLFDPQKNLKIISKIYRELL